MKRKIIKLGQATFVASLPSKWIRDHHLDKGDYLDCIEQEGALLLSAKKIYPTREVSINLLDYHERSIRNVLNQTYRKGFDIIRLRYSKPDQLAVIKHIVKNTLLGFEVVKEEKGLCVVENIAEPSVEKFPIILRKLFLTIKGEAEEIVDCIKNNMDLDMKKREELKHTIDNYTNFSRRLIVKHKIRGSEESYLMFYIVSFISLIHHAYYYLAKYLDKQKANLDPEIVQFLPETVSMYDLLYQAYFKNDMQIAHQVGLLKDSFIPRIYTLLEKHKGVNNVVLYHIGEIVRLTQMSATILFGFVEEDKT